MPRQYRTPRERRQSFNRYSASRFATPEARRKAREAAKKGGKFEQSVESGDTSLLTSWDSPSGGVTQSTAEEIYKNIGLDAQDAAVGAKMYVKGSNQLTMDERRRFGQNKAFLDYLKSRGKSLSDVVTGSNVFGGGGSSPATPTATPAGEPATPAAIKDMEPELVSGPAKRQKRKFTLLKSQGQRQTLGQDSLLGA